MIGHEHVVGVRIREDLQAGILQFRSHQNGKNAADHAGANRKHQVHGPDVFVVCRIDDSGASPVG